MRPVVLLSAPLAPVALIGGWTWAAARQPPSYDAVRDTISALAAEGATDPWIMTTGIAVLGGAHVVTALGLTEARPLGRVLLGAGGVSAVLVAVFAQPSPAHFPVATASFVLLSAWPFFSGTPTRAAAVTAGVGLSALLGWFALELDGPRTGLAERVVAGAQALWPLATVLGTRALSRRGSRARPLPGGR